MPHQIQHFMTLATHWRGPEATFVGFEFRSRPSQPDVGGKNHFYCVSKLAGTTPQCTRVKGACRSLDATGMCQGADDARQAERNICRVSFFPLECVAEGFPFYG